MKLPRLVQDAKKFEYPFPITGFLVNAELRANEVIHGYVYSDAKGRFDDGTYISTAPVVYIQVELERHVAHTESGSSYVICNYNFPSGYLNESGVSVEFTDTTIVRH